MSLSTAAKKHNIKYFKSVWMNVLEKATSYKPWYLANLAFKKMINKAERVKEKGGDCSVIRISNVLFLAHTVGDIWFDIWQVVEQLKVQTLFPGVKY
jgi:hypothetical protein